MYDAKGHGGGGGLLARALGGFGPEGRREPGLDFDSAKVVICGNRQLTLKAQKANPRSIVKIYCVVLRVDSFQAAIFEKLKQDFTTTNAGRTTTFRYE